MSVLIAKVFMVISKINISEKKNDISGTTWTGRYMGINQNLIICPNWQRMGVAI
jgi:hypothetical protein